jgi:hypothetical protein
LVFSKIISHTARFLHFLRIWLFWYLDYLIFAHHAAREALSAAQKMLHILPQFLWLVLPTKCQGVAVVLQRFLALGSMVCLASQSFSDPEATVTWEVAVGQALLATAGLVSCRALALFRGLVGSTWILMGVASRLRVCAMTAVIKSRPRRHLRVSWNALVALSEECQTEIP